jgi:hypothetical protein
MPAIAQTTSTLHITQAELHSALSRIKHSSKR